MMTAGSSDMRWLRFGAVQSHFRSRNCPRHTERAVSRAWRIGACWAIDDRPAGHLAAGGSRSDGIPAKNRKEATARLIRDDSRPPVSRLAPLPVRAML